MPPKGPKPCDNPVISGVSFHRKREAIAKCPACSGSWKKVAGYAAASKAALVGSPPVNTPAMPSADEIQLIETRYPGVQVVASLPKTKPMPTEAGATKSVAATIDLFNCRDHKAARSITYGGFVMIYDRERPDYYEADELLEYKDLNAFPDEESYPTVMKTEGAWATLDTCEARIAEVSKRHPDVFFIVPDPQTDPDGRYYDPNATQAMAVVIRNGQAVFIDWDAPVDEVLTATGFPFIHSIQVDEGSL